MRVDKYFDGRCWVVNRNGNQCAGRTPEQAQYTANLINEGKIFFDKDGIGIRAPFRNEFATWGNIALPENMWIG